MQANLATADVHPVEGQMKGWHALLWFLGFFGFMFAVNGIFLWTAITTFPGEDVDKSYLAGLDYNAQLAQRARQAEAGWSAEIGLTGAAPEQFVRVHLSARDGSPLAASDVRIDLRHPADRGLDQALTLTAAGSGDYIAAMPDVSAGLWNIHLSADVDPSSEGMDLQAVKAVEIP